MLRKNAKKSLDSFTHNSDIEEDYIVGEELGRGTSGVVHHLIKRDTLEVFAGKALDISNADNLNDVNTEVKRLVDNSSESTIEIYATYFYQDRAWVSETCTPFDV